jgi:hypothetical protein
VLADQVGAVVDGADAQGLGGGVAVWEGVVEIEVEAGKGEVAQLGAAARGDRQQGGDEGENHFQQADMRRHRDGAGPVGLARARGGVRREGDFQ